MLVCRHPGLFFEYIRPVGEFFFSFWDGKNNINPYLLNLIFEFVGPLHFLCLLLLKLQAVIINSAYFNPDNLQLAD